jgi:[acyl-carrier-protein] S-malonyltransferase
MPGDNASLLIYACALADFAAIDRDRFEVVAVTGNSMGWYLALELRRRGRF